VWGEREREREGDRRTYGEAIEQSIVEGLERIEDRGLET
jgi:hypothetical protein